MKFEHWFDSIQVKFCLLFADSFYLKIKRSDATDGDTNEETCMLN
jgi:hypothetical protein